jgi:predicted transposase/invertase (TIGR01784 family)
MKRLSDQIAILESNIERSREEGREEGIKVGIKTGREEGIKAGREEGIKAGREEGIKAGRKDIARTMLANGMDRATVAQMTGLSEAELDRLREDSNDDVQ